MKQFLYKVGFFSLLIIASIALCKILLYGKNKVAKEYDVKCELLKNTPGPRLIFVSGSNLAFGLDSKRIQDSLHINVVNTGLSVFLGLRYMIDDVSNYLQDGDILVIAPEYQHFYGWAYGIPSDMLPHAIQYNPANWRILNGRQRYALISGYLTSVKYVTKIFKTNSNSIESKVVYNEYGDEIYHWSCPSYSTTSDESLKILDKFDEEFARYFTGRLDSISKTNRVLVMPPVIVSSGFYHKKGQIEELADFLKRNGHPFIVPPSEHVVPDTCIFETEYHVIKTGVDYITGKIIDELHPLLAE